MKKTIVALVGLVLLSGCGAKASGKPAPAANSPTGGSHSPGQALIPDASSSAPFMLPPGTSALVYAESGADNFSARVTVASIVTTNQTVSPVTNTPPKNGRYVVADISIQCISQTPCYFDTFDWDAVNPSGQSFSEAIWRKEPALDSGELAPGRTIRGYLTIDATADVRELTYGSNSNPAASWKIR